MIDIFKKCSAPQNNPRRAAFSSDKDDNSCSLIDLEMQRAREDDPARCKYQKIKNAELKPSF
jgi:hypothetical protein